jgi:tetratricopeptide (TPR) repeat protein
MEGSLRQAGSTLRMTVQLVDTITGAHLWAETYNREFSPEAVFAIQDDLVPRIVSTVADQYGALVHSMSESLRDKRSGEFTAHKAVLRAFGYFGRISPEEHLEVRDILEAAIAASPDHSDCLAQLASMCWHEHAHGYNLNPDPLGRGLAFARRAVASSPTNHHAHYALATVFFFRKDFLAFRPAAERSLMLNPMDASTKAFLGVITAYSGDWERGLELVERSIDLNPNHPGWYYFPAFHYAYINSDYPRALEIALKINMPGYFFNHTALAAAYGQLGEPQRASAVLNELRTLAPGLKVREEYRKWFDDEITKQLMDGLRKAGLETG